MKRFKTEAIVLHTIPTRERDKLVVFLTPDHGKKKGWAYGARSIKSRFGASLEPLSRVGIGYLEKEGDETVRIETIDLRRSPFDAYQDLAASVAAPYIAETIDTFAPPEEPAELMFRLLDRATEALMKKRSAELVVAWVEVWVLKLAGVFPSMKHCVECHGELQRPLRYDPDRSGFVCGECAPRSLPLFPNDIADALELILATPIATLLDEPLPPPVLFEIRSVARSIRRHFLGHELRSHDILAGVLAQRTG